MQTSMYPVSAHRLYRRRNFVLLFMFLPSDCRRRYYVFGLSVRRVRSFVRPDTSCNYHDISDGMSNLDETSSE